MQTNHLWQLWPGRHWPLMRREEDEFRSELVRLSGGLRSPHDRGDHTAVLNALRCGLSVSEVLFLAPGLVPSRLLSAYETLDARLQVSLNAWRSIEEEPTESSLIVHGSAAKLILPVVVDSLRTTLVVQGEAGLPSAVARMQVEIIRARREADAAEEALASGLLEGSEAVSMGRVLYNPYDPGLWGSAHYLPERVGVLMPIRVVDLLGERRRAK